MALLDRSNNVAQLLMPQYKTSHMGDEVADWTALEYLVWVQPLTSGDVDDQRGMVYRERLRMRMPRGGSMALTKATRVTFRHTYTGEFVIVQEPRRWRGSNRVAHDEYVLERV